MLVYRISKAIYAHDLTGTGAKIYGGRWNSKGIPVVYTAESRSLAVLELLAHIQYPSIPADLIMSTLTIPDKIKITSVLLDTLPTNWDHFPYNPYTQQIGNNWFKEMKSAILQVPSAIVKNDHNYLLNPVQRDFGDIKIINQEPFQIDNRILW